MDIDITQYIFLQMTIGIVLTTMIVKTQVITRLHPKWITLIVAVFGGVVQYLMYLYECYRQADTCQAFEIWKAVNSMGIAIIGYDYFVKVVKDFVAKKDPLSK